MKDTDLKWLNNYYNTCGFPIKTGREALKVIIEAVVF